MSDRFRHDNTEGYSSPDLAELNARFIARCQHYHVDLDSTDVGEQSRADAIAEQVMAGFDQE